MNSNRFSQGVGLVAKVVLISSSVALLGAACWKGVGTNTNVGVGNGNVGVNENANTVAGNVNAEVNTNANANTNTNSTGEVDTSDWLTYTNEEYGFRVKYPDNWIVFNKIDTQGYAIYDSNITNFVRFTDEKNKQSASSFVDISITVSESVVNAEKLRYVEHNGRFYIFNEGTWPTEESLDILNEMIKSIQFDS